MAVDGCSHSPRKPAQLRGTDKGSPKSKNIPLASSTTSARQNQVPVRKAVDEEDLEDLTKQSPSPVSPKSVHFTPTFEESDPVPFSDAKPELAKSEVREPKKRFSILHPFAK